MKRWIVAIAGITCILGPGSLTSFSLFSSSLNAAFGWAPSQITWAFALANLFLGIGSLVGGLLNDRFGPRYVAVMGISLWAGGYALCSTLASSHSLPLFYLYFGIIGGSGVGIAYIASLSAVIKWFPRARGFGGGLVIMGFGFGSFVYNSVVKPSAAFASISASSQTYAAAKAAAAAQHLPFDHQQYAMNPATLAVFMSIYAWSGAILAIVGITAALLLSNPPADDPQYVPRERQYAATELVSDPRFYVLWAMIFLNTLGGITVISNMVPLMHEINGMSVPEAAALYGFLAIFNGLGRFAWGALSDRVSRRVTFALMFGGQAIAFFALDSTQSPIGVAIAIGILLACYGGGFGVMPAFCADFFGTKNIGANYGLLLTGFGLAAIFGTYLLSVIKSVSGSYLGLMQPISIALLVAMFFPLIIESAKKVAKHDETSGESGASLTAA